MATSTELIPITLEYKINTSPSLLYSYLSEPVRLQEWFADDVNYDENGYVVFKWTSSDEKQIAEIVGSEKDTFIRFRWLDSPEDTYVELRIVSTELSKQTILVIQDFVSSREEHTQRQLWDYQVKELMHILGSY